jgi:hypothetical protein
MDNLALQGIKLGWLASGKVDLPDWLSGEAAEMPWAAVRKQWF